MTDDKSDPRKLYRLTPAERTLIVDAVTTLAAEHLLDDEQRERIADLIVRMT